MKFEFSAGGVVFKQEKRSRIKSGMTTFILLCQHSQHHGWVFPKGFIGDKIKGEKKEDTAVREVQEETGVVGKILKPLDPVIYWYVMDGEKHKKTVYYYIMVCEKEDISKHDFEMENVEWLPSDKVEERLTFPSDKKVWEEAKPIIENL